LTQTLLFDIDNISTVIKKKEKKTKSKAVKNNEKTISKLGKAKQKVNEVIGNVQMDQTTHYASMGEWSMHDLLFHLLEQTGPASVYISTWSLSENSIRQLLQKINDGIILKLYGVFDWRVKIRRPEAFQLARYNISDIRLTTTHAKVTVIENGKWNIAIEGSANYTNNPRIEAGVISCNKIAADFHKKWMLEKLNKSDLFEAK